jgi:crotonobetainyl-CoA:carnitine CoA-transferase CaiB-like acyl-CoA transferase
VNTIDRVTADPQINHRGMVIDLVSDDGRRAKVMGDPIFMRESRRASHTFPPAAGEHTEIVLKELLGMSATEINALIARGSAFARDGVTAEKLTSQGAG